MEVGATADAANVRLTRGGANGTRTRNPLLAKQVRCQLRHGPGWEDDVDGTPTTASAPTALLTRLSGRRQLSLQGAAVFSRQICIYLQQNQALRIRRGRSSLRKYPPG